MIVCPACQHNNPEEAAFCEECGESLEGFLYRACPSCGSLNAADGVFCHRCLTNLSASPEQGTLSREEGLTDTPPLSARTERESVTAPEPPPAQEVAPPRLPPVGQTPESPLADSKVRELQADELREDPALEPDREEEPSGAEHQLLGGEGAIDDSLVDDHSVEDVAPGFLSRRAPETLPSEGTGVKRTEVGNARVGPARRDIESSAMDSQAPEAASPETEVPAFLSCGTRGLLDEIAEDVELRQDAVEPDSGLPGVSAVEALPAAAGASPLEGLDNLLDAEQVISLPHRAVSAASRRASEVEQREAELFRQIATEPAPLDQPTRLALPQGTGRLSKVGRVLIYLLVLLAALTPTFSGGQTRFWVRPREGVAAFAQDIKSLREDSMVLISFDYDPAYAGELDPLILAVVRHLKRQSVRVAAMSIKPGGIGLALQVYAELSAEDPAYTMGEDFDVLGYLPGQEAGLSALSKGLGAAFAGDLGERATEGPSSILRDADTLADFAGIIVVSDSSEAVRLWLEQVQRRVDVPVDALVTARVEPMLVPYQQSGQLRSLIGGAYGAAEYEAASLAPPSALKNTDAYAALLALLVLIAIAANVPRLGKRKRSSAQER